MGKRGRTWSALVVVLALGLAVVLSACGSSNKSNTTAATSGGGATLLASGMKISAEPKPEKPRAVPDTNAITPMARAVLAVTSVGMRPVTVRLML